MRRITTFLMFKGNAEIAMNFYLSLFENSQIVSIARYGANQGGAEGSVQHATFRLGEQEFMCIDSDAPHAFGFTPAISLFVECTSQVEIGTLFAKLSGGGQIMMPLGPYPFADRFAWLADKFGVSWQLRYVAPKP